MRMTCEASTEDKERTLFNNNKKFFSNREKVLAWSLTNALLATCNIQLVFHSSQKFLGKNSEDDVMFIILREMSKYLSETRKKNLIYW